MSERPLVLALDQGTTSSRAMLFDRRGNVVGVAQREHRQIFPRPGWVEHDADEIWRAQIGVAEETLRRAEVGAADVAAVGIANQRETTILWEKTTLRPLHNAIVWQDRRTAAAVESLEEAGYGRTIRDKTGLIPDAYFSASKIAWLLDNVPGARRRAASGDLAVGTIDSWLIAKLTNGAVHATDASNASRTMLYDIHRGSWDEELLAIFDVPKALLPTVVASRGVIAEIDVDSTVRGLPLAGVVGDQQAALAGQLCHRPGLAKNTYGTGCFLLVNTGSQAIASRHRMLTTVAWQADGALTYALEGSVFTGGAVVQWLRDGLGIIRSAREVEALARSVPDNGGVFLVPAFAGLGAPYWDPHARGTICGITGGTTAGHLARAALEAIALQVADLADAMAADCELPVAELRVDGGAAGNNLLLQIQADLLEVPISRPRVTETTALGAALMAGLGVGVWRDAGELEAERRIDRCFEPTASRGSVALLRERWAEALRRARDWEASATG